MPSSRPVTDTVSEPLIMPLTSTQPRKDTTSAITLRFVMGAFQNRADISTTKEGARYSKIPATAKEQCI